MSNIRDLIDAIESGKTVDIQQHFESIMTDKMLNAIEQRKHDIAQGLFKESVEEEQIEEDVDILEELSQLDESELDEFLSELDESEMEALLQYVEESEQLDELSKQTLGNYIKKASTDIHNSAWRSKEGFERGDYAKGTDNFKKSAKRQMGTIRAAQKLTREDLELEEAKNPDAIKSVGSSASQKGAVIVITNSGAKYTITAKQTGGAMPKPGELISKYVKEEVEPILEMQYGKEYSLEYIMKKIKSGDWEAQTDVKPGKYVELRHHSGKTVTVRVK